MLHVGDIVVWVDLSGGALVAEGLGEAAAVGQAVVAEDSVDLVVEVLVVAVQAVNGKILSRLNRITKDERSVATGDAMKYLSWYKNKKPSHCLRGFYYLNDQIKILFYLQVEFFL